VSGHEPVEFRKRVAVSEGAVQLIPVIAAEVESLTVYQRTRTGRRSTTGRHAEEQEGSSGPRRDLREPPGTSRVLHRAEAHTFDER
jgi:hypothetical protein